MISEAMAGECGMLAARPTTACTVLCCNCGIQMTPNLANMCPNCLRSIVDITEGLQKNVMISHCPDCDGYLQPPRTWTRCRPESKELLAFCLRRLKNLNKVRLVDARFIYTEPHCKRIKVMLKVQKEALSGAILEQPFLVEYVKHEHLCESCSRVKANPDQWVAVVQLRQHVSHRRTFLYLEQLILKHDAAAHAIRIKQMNQGIDFFFANRSHGLKFVEFVRKVAPIRSRHDKQLVSHDTKSNSTNFRYTFSLEICPICREDLVFLPPKVAASLGNPGPLLICIKVTDSITLLDPLTLRHCFLDADRYWRAPFKPLLTCRQLVQYVVQRIDMVSSEFDVGGSMYTLADVTVARVTDRVGSFSTKTHLGHILRPGDHALGYDLYGANLNDVELDRYKGLGDRNVILIKKSYEQKLRLNCGKTRPWKLKSLNMEFDPRQGRICQEKMNSEYEEFLKDLEENPEMRFNISLYHNGDHRPSDMASMTDGEDAPFVPLEELVAGLDLSDEEVGEDCMEE